MNKAQVIHKVHDTWQELYQACDGLPPASMLQPGVAGSWSIKDLLSHVAWWEEEALKYLPLILQGSRPPRYSILYGGIDAFNDSMASQRSAWSLDQVIHDARSTHSQLLAYIETIPETSFSSKTRFRHRLRLDTYGHYPVHTRSILDWRILCNL